MVRRRTTEADEDGCESASESEGSEEGSGGSGEESEGSGEESEGRGARGQR